MIACTAIEHEAALVTHDAALKDGAIGGLVVEVDVPPVTDLAVGPTHVCVLLNDGSVRCWGNNNEGQANPESAEATVRSPARITL